MGKKKNIIVPAFLATSTPSTSDWYIESLSESKKDYKHTSFIPLTSECIEDRDRLNNHTQDLIPYKPKQ